MSLGLSIFNSVYLPRVSIFVSDNGLSIFNTVYLPRVSTFVSDKGKYTRHTERRSRCLFELTCRLISNLGKLVHKLSSLFLRALWHRDSFIPQSPSLIIVFLSWSKHVDAYQHAGPIEECGAGFEIVRKSQFVGPHKSKTSNTNIISIRVVESRINLSVTWMITVDDYLATPEEYTSRQQQQRDSVSRFPAQLYATQSVTV